MPDYLLKKSTGEIELVSGSEPFTVTPSFGDGDYEVFCLENGTAITVGGWLLQNLTPTSFDIVASFTHADTPLATAVDANTIMIGQADA